MARTFSLLLAVLIGISSCAKDEAAPRADVRTPEVLDAGEGAQPISEPLADAAVPDATPSELPLGVCAGPPGRTLRTLIIGNSNIYYYDLPRILSVLSESGPPACPRIAAEGFTRGGQNLRRLWEGGDSQGRNLEAVIRDGRYDVVVMSESIDLLELDPPHTQYVEYATKIVRAAQAAGSRPVIYASPYPDQKGHFGFREMAEPQLALGKALSVSVAAAGLAWLRVWEELPDVFLHHGDHSHPGFKGSMISSMVLYAVLTRGTPIGLTTAPAIDCYGKPCPEITPEEGDVFQRAAWAEARATGGIQ